jgi:hypothetical protein
MKQRTEQWRKSMNPKVGSLKRSIKLQTFNLTGKEKKSIDFITKIRNEERLHYNLTEIKKIIRDHYVQQSGGACNPSNWGD